jgi:hypothetical protein
MHIWLPTNTSSQTWYCMQRALACRTTCLGDKKKGEVGEKGSTSATQKPASYIRLRVQQPQSAAAAEASGELKHATADC